MAKLTEQLAELLIATFGAGNVLHGDALADRDTAYSRHCYDAGVLVLPDSTADVVTLCKLAETHSFSLVPQGGLTGLVDATSSEPGQVCVSFERMNRILDIDPAQGVVTCEPGVILQALFDSTSATGLMPGVDIPSRGSCTVGGLVATNAGGVRVIRYGMMRENILGLEAVLANGDVIDATNTLMKNNAGYDIKQMFIGTEGTIGLITKVVLRLHPVPGATGTALIACEDIDAAMGILQMARLSLDARLLSFEVMWPEYVALTASQPGLGSPPMDLSHGMYVLLEIAGDDSDDCAKTLSDLLESALAQALLVDAVVAQSDSQRQHIWRIRDDSDAISHICDAYLSYDVGMPLAHMADYVAQFRLELARENPQRTPYIFGHMGDGNLHIMFTVSKDEFDRREDFDRIVYAPLAQFANTTISAEHGIGLEKKPFLHWSRSAASVGAMHAFKKAMDPNGLLNPGKVF